MAKGRKTGGRVKGVPNAVNTDIAAAAREHGQMCIDVLANIVLTCEAEVAARAAGILLNRGFGMPHQGVSVASTGSITVELISYAGRQAVPVLTVPRGNGHTAIAGPPGGHHSPSSE